MLRVRSVQGQNFDFIFFLNVNPLSLIIFHFYYTDTISWIFSGVSEHPGASGCNLGYLLDVPNLKIKMF